MRNYRFRLSDMMPNAWFYKLKDMGKSRNQNHSCHPILKKHIHPTSHPPNPKHHSSSLYYSTKHKFHTSPINPKASDTHFPETPPRKSTKKTRRRAPRTSTSSSSSSSAKVLTSSVSAGCSCRATLSSAWKPDSPPTDYSASPGSPPPDHQSLIPSPPETFDHGIAKWSSSCSCRVTSSATDIIIDVDTKRSFDDFDSIPGLDLPSIVTKPPKFDGLLVEIEKKEMQRQPNRLTRQNCSTQLQERKEKNGRHGSASGPMKILKERSLTSLKEETTSPIARRPSFSSAPQGGLKIRSNSPRIANKKIQSCNRKSVSVSSASSRPRRRSVSESFAVVKSSFDPQRDFRDSMVEMIIENNIRASKDLEELLACYLSLNSDEYHDLIVKVFEQIWFDLTDLRL